jgi:hypothetical protein
MPRSGRLCVSGQDAVASIVAFTKTTLVGRVTVQVLNINAPSRVRLRENLLFEGRFPPE